ncbi:MAG: oxygen-independent coproporphyrinogen III oxidase [Oleispira antarctica]|uniref:Coproporphyrinogen-III oxidase n=1 Tax=Oleispira antarctica RB-8 TaxID=698738 RepID=R4YSY6_OLEAN|nr:oxygen-independent coproporphyrinogen III oxidase [Oleispira antarctica]CCK76503.1 Oxygen-independent coproporphyrinogen III oxidase [Oleispira antarctica RB-8]
MSEQLNWDPELIQRYNRSGPRYTSYPTAVEFKVVENDQVEKDLLSQRNQDVPLSLYLHIPFCAHVCYYCGCNKIVTKDRSKSEPYLDLLKAEIDRKAELLQGHPIVEQMHWGGGTPTFLSDEQMTDLMDHLRKRFTFSTDDSADYSIEIDPREVRPNTLKLLREIGFNRTSFGVQDLNEKVQQAVNRIQPESMIRKVMTEARELGFRSINIDLIYGLPHQSQQTFAETLDVIIDMSPDRLSVFNYAHLPERFKPQRRIKEEDLPSPEEKLAILGNCITTLTKVGYHYVGMDHFAKPDDELSRAQGDKVLHRNFQGYTTHGDCDLIGFGVSSISQISDCYLQNSPDINVYEEAINSNHFPVVKIITTDKDDLIRRQVIMELLCHDQMIFSELDQAFSIDSRAYFTEELSQLSPMVEDALLEISNEGIHITEKGRLLVRNACMVFDTYLNANIIQSYSASADASSTTNRPRFSKAI